MRKLSGVAVACGRSSVGVRVTVWVGRGVGVERTGRGVAVTLPLGVEDGTCASEGLGSGKRKAATIINNKRMGNRKCLNKAISFLNGEQKWVRTGGINSLALLTEKSQSLIWAMQLLNFSSKSHRQGCGKIPGTIP